MGPLTLCDYCNSEDGPHPLSWGAIRAKLSATERERDEARAMLAESKASLDRVGPIADECLQIAKTMAGSREEAAASERAAIVAYLRADADAFDKLATPMSDSEMDEKMRATARRLRTIAGKVERLDHHRDGGG